MVLSERVAWPEYMDTIRATLTKQAEAIAKQGAALDACSGSRGGKEGVAERRGDSVSGGGAIVKAVPDPWGRDPGSRTAPGLAAGGVRSFPQSSHDLNDKLGRPPAAPDGRKSGETSRVLSPSGAESAVTSSPAERSRRPSRREDVAAPPVAAAAIATAATAQPLKLGRAVKGTTTAGPESWSLFSFDLPSAGPVLTVVLDAVDGEPEVVVWRARPPPVRTTSQGSTTPKILAERKGGGGGPDRGGGGGGRERLVGEWTASSAHRDVRVVKIYPRDTK